MERLTVRVKEGNRKDECFIPGNKNAIEKFEYICEGERWESEEYKGKAVDKLAEYEDLEEQNKLLKLPCAVGDMVYYRYDGIKIAPMHVEKIIIAKYGVNLLLAYCGNDEKLEYWTIDIESTAINCGIVFLTREEAEAALKELERCKGE